MRIILRLIRTELAALFYTPIAWFILIIFSTITAGTFVDIIGKFIEGIDLGYYDSSTLSFSAMIFNGDYGFYNSMIKNIFIYIPLLTMGLISRELSSGSIKLLYSSPVSSIQIVIGKYIASIKIGATLLVVPIIGIIVSSFYIPNFDWPPVLVGLMGVYLLICTYSAIGLFMSSLTKYQIVAAVGTLVLFAGFNYVGNVGQEYNLVREITYWLSIPGRTLNLVSGLIQIGDIAYFVLVSLMFLGFTTLHIKFGRMYISKIKKALCYCTIIVIIVCGAYFSSIPSLNKTFDCTRTKDLTITKNSQEIIKQLKGEVTITNYVNLFDRSSSSYFPMSIKSNSHIFQQYKRFKTDLREKYVYYYAPSINGIDHSPSQVGKTIEQIRDYAVTVYNLNPHIFLSPEEISKVYDLSSENNSFVRVVEAQNGRSIMLRDYQDNSRIPLESEITAALQRLVSDENPKVGFIIGNEQREVYKPGDRDYSSFAVDKYSRVALVNQGFDVVSINLANGEGIDEDINILVIADAKEELGKTELRQINEYIEKGGNMIVLTDEKRKDSMEPILDIFGLSSSNRSLVQPLGALAPNLIIANTTSGADSLTFGFKEFISKRNKKISMPGSVALRINKDNNFEKIPLLTTNTKGAWLESDSESIKNEEVNISAGEKEDEYVVAYALQRKIEKKIQKVLVFGDADCLSNSELRVSRDGYLSGNNTLIQESFRWMSDGKYPIDTRRPDCIDNTINLTIESIPFLSNIFKILIPVLMFIIGLALWLLRSRN